MSVAISRPTVALFALLVLVSAPTLTAQDAEAQYTQQEYDAYQAAVEKGGDSIIAFLKANPDSALAQYAVGAYEQAMAGYLEKGDHKSTVAAGEKYLAEIDGERYSILFLTAWSAYHSQQYAKATKWGERTIAKKPDDSRLVPILARSYQHTDKKAKFVEWGEKACASGQPKDCFDLFPDLMKHFFAVKNMRKADSYAAKTIQAFDTVDKPDGVSSSEWANYVKDEKTVALTVRGKSAFDRKDWPGTRKYFGELLRVDGANKARKAEAHYHIGMAYWNQKNIDRAMENFARGAKVSATAFSKPCRTQLELLYKSTHNDSLQGLDDFVSRVAG